MNNSIIECAGSTAQTKNTGAKEQCLTGPVLRHVLAKMEQSFDNKEDAKDLTKWKDAEANKEVIPLFTLEALTNANTEATYYEGREKYKTKEAKKIVTFEVHLGICSYKALHSYDSKKMRVYEFTDDQKLVATTPDGTKVRGQVVTIKVGIQIPATDDKPQHCVVTLTYEDWKEFVNSPVELKPTWSHIESQGIFDVQLVLVSASATSIKFKATTGCSSGGDVVKEFIDANVVLKDASGSAYTHTFVPADADGVYTLTGTAFANNFTVDLDGVVQSTEATYESTGALVLTGI